MKALILILACSGVAYCNEPTFANCPSSSTVMGRNITNLHFVAQVKVVNAQDRYPADEHHRRYTVDLETFYHHPYKNRYEYLSHHYNPRTINILASRGGRSKCGLTLDIGESYVVIGSMGVYEVVKRYDDLSMKEKLYLVRLAYTPPKFD